MISRIFLIHTHIGYPLIICSFYFLFNEKFQLNLYKKNFIKFLSILIFFTSLVLIYNYENRPYKSDKDLISKILYRINKFENNFSNSLSTEHKKFWKQISDLNSNGFFVTTFDTSEPTLKFGNKPYIINAKYFDLVPYHPHTVDEVKLILEQIYNISFSNPPENFTPEIPDKWIIKIFERRTNAEWIKLSKQFNLYGIIVPSSWSINIDKTITSNKFTFYKLN